MNVAGVRFLQRQQIFQTSLAVTLFISGLVGATAARAGDDGIPFPLLPPFPLFQQFEPGNLLVSRSVYDNNSTNVAVGEALPPNCVAPNCVAATNNGSYPTVWNNVLADASFGITSKIMLDQLRPTGQLINSLEVPNSSERGTPPSKDQMVTSFSSKSEIALNLSTDGRAVTFMGYLAPIEPIRCLEASRVLSRRSISSATSALRRATPIAATTGARRSSTTRTASSTPPAMPAMDRIPSRTASSLARARRS
jgi:hypothetical protein